MRETPVLGPNDVWLLEEFRLLHDVIAATARADRFSPEDIDVVLGIQARIPDQRRLT